MILINNKANTKHFLNKKIIDRQRKEDLKKGLSFRIQEKITRARTRRMTQDTIVKHLINTKLLNQINEQPNKELAQEDESSSDSSASDEPDAQCNNIKKK